MVLSGGANLLSAEQWARDPLGNLLKSAADIVTGLTIILGSIAGLCLALTVICGALIIFSFGTLAPVLGPAIAFFSSVMATVGPWAIEFAEVALVLQGLVLIKNLIDAATAQTAEQLDNSSEKMTEDARNAGQMAIQVGMASLMEGGGEAPEAPTLEPEAGAIPAEPPALEPVPEPEPMVEPTAEPGAKFTVHLCAGPRDAAGASPERRFRRRLVVHHPLSQSPISATATTTTTMMPKMVPSQTLTSHGSSFQSMRRVCRRRHGHGPSV